MRPPTLYSGHPYTGDLCGSGIGQSGDLPREYSASFALELMWRRVMTACWTADVHEKWAGLPGGLSGSRVGCRADVCRDAGVVAGKHGDAGYGASTVRGGGMGTG